VNLDRLAQRYHTQPHRLLGFGPDNPYRNYVIDLQSAMEGAKQDEKDAEERERELEQERQQERMLGGYGKRH